MGTGIRFINQPAVPSLAEVDLCTSVLNKLRREVVEDSVGLGMHVLLEVH
jgi:hypothetical protein